MLIKEIFEKDVQRRIEGVIKADDASHLETEIEEYVLTNEITSGLEHLLEEYTNYENANGVWISGFFGSGKSHLLKMLAHLLGDVDGQDYSRSSVVEGFKEKAGDSAFLQASLTKSESIPSKSLLFNIDQKATLIAKDQTDALLKVFVKVFDESRGYYGNQGHVAKFEADLDGRGQYQEFKDAYARISGRPWEQGREEGVLEEHNVAAAYAEVTGQTEGTPTNILTKYRNEYGVSIEDFAEDVKAWLDKQEPGFRLNFFVDEVGQFIGNDTKLMLNLQTIAESLNTKCNGQAWVFVTSQEDMEKILGDRTKWQANDFSKIQARFDTRLKLTSADVEEVIRKRLLSKNEKGKEVLDVLWQGEQGNFKTLFDFVDGAKTYRNYPDRELFVGTYPFVSYQFPLFQMAIESISDHNVFEGRHSSVGERSMLGVVQEVVKEIADDQVGTLATFDQMFSGIRKSLKSSAQRAIDVAERNLEDELAVRLLKALFLVKYVDDFKATARNLTVLVYDHFGLDLPDLHRRVQESLNLLEAQTYIQRNGNVYEYLTDLEQDMEKEIKNVDVSSFDVTDRLSKVLSSDVIKSKKVRYEKNKQDFSFGYKLDDHSIGHQHDLSLHFITPAYEYEFEDVRLQSSGKDELRVVLEPDARLMSDLGLLLRTEKYIKQKQTSSLSASEQRILQHKAAQNSERERELVGRVRDAVSNARLIINATEVQPSSQEAQARVIGAFQELISRSYAQLKLLGDRVYSERQITDAANPERSGSIDGMVFPELANAADEVLSYVIQRERLGERATVKSIVENFQAKPYGWDLASIEVVIAWLVGDGKVSLKVDSNTLKRSEIPGVLSNTHKHPYIFVELQKHFDQRKVNNLRSFYQEFFDEPAAPKDPLELAHRVAENLRVHLEKLQALAEGSKYPFVAELDQPIGLLKQVVGKSDEWYLTEFNQADPLLDQKNDTIDPILAFFGGGQLAIYDQAQKMLATNARNLAYLPAGSEHDVVDKLADRHAFRGAKMPHLKTAVLELQEAIDKELASRRSISRESIEARHSDLTQSILYQNATVEAQRKVDQRISALLQKIEDETQIGAVNEIANNFEDEDYTAIFDFLDANQKSEPGPDQGDPTPPRLKEKAESRTVSLKTVTQGMSGVLENDEDVDRYMEELSRTLRETIHSGKRITI